jgi:hypothetical protein
MNELDELELVNKLKMYYTSNIFDKISGKSISDMSAEDKQKNLYEKLFIDRENAFTIAEIIKKAEEEVPAESLLGKIADVLGMSGDEEEEIVSKFFSLSTYQVADIKETNAFGDISFSTDGYVKTLFPTEITNTDNFLQGSDIALIHVIDNALHPASHSVDAAEVFLNYIPVIERSRCTPYFKVEVLSRGSANWTKDLAVLDELVESIDMSSVGREVTKDYESLATLSFLTGNEKIEKDQYNTADAAMTMASTQLFTGTSVTTTDAADETKTDTKTTQGYSIRRDGMEMFTMPQSLISKKEGVNVDPFRPFMSLKSATIHTQSAGQGLISFNTAELVIEVYDRHRLEDISFFLDPGKFNFTSFELAVGWNHQDPSSPYGRYLNRMISKELYQLVSSSYTFNDAGVVTVTMKLAMQGRHSIANSSMFASGEDGKGVREAYEVLQTNLRAIQSGTASINSGRKSGNLLPTSIITQTKNSQAMIIDRDALTTVRAGYTISASGSSMSDEKREEFDKALMALEGGALKDYYDMLEEYISEFFKEIGVVEAPSDRIKEETGNKIDEFRMTDGAWETRKKGSADNWITVNEAATKTLNKEFPNEAADQEKIKSGDSIPFDKLFLNAIAKRMLTGEPKVADEIHIFMYSFNRKAPGVKGSYIGDWLIDEGRISVKLKEKIRETQNLTIIDLVSCVRAMMKDKLDIQFKIVTKPDVDSIRALEEGIAKKQGDIREKNSAITKLISEKDVETDDAKKKVIQKEADAHQTKITDLNEEIAAESKTIKEMKDSGETRLKNSQKTANLRMPDLKVLIETKKTSGSIIAGKDSTPKTIIRIHIYDGNSKPNELATFLANLGNETSYDWGDGADDLSQSAAVIHVEKLTKLGLADIVDLPQPDGTIKQKLVVNLRSKAFKQAIKESMPSITYGIAGTAINKISISGISDANMQAHFLLQTQTGNYSNVQNEKVNFKDTDAQKIMPVNISLDMMGCPLMRYGQEYFIDLDTNTDLDNVYAATKITHNISAGAFTTRVEMKPTYSSPASFGNLLADIHLVSKIPPTETEK